MVEIKKLTTYVFRFPLATPIQTSFGTMRDRPMLLVKVIDKDGACGWGEIWCNFPAYGAEHRARMVADTFADILTARTFTDAQEAFDVLTAITHILAIQSGEHGPIRQCIAGLDIALHDLAGKKAGLPLWQLLGGRRDNVPIYASGINPTQPELIVTKALAAGYRNFKLKVGFGNDIDFANLKKLRTLIAPAGMLMADANQAWDIEQACANVARLQEFDLTWLEEPIAADRPAAEWMKLKQAASMPIAAGENIAGTDAFKSAIAADLFDVIQPDLAKWGGITKGLPVAKAIIAANRRYCPHFLGGGIGLVASAHLLAAAGGDGLLEVDINENPLRTCCVGNLLSANDGMAALSPDAGLGVEPDLAALKPYLVAAPSP